jgi:hypothetical protein
VLPPSASWLAQIAGQKAGSNQEAPSMLAPNVELQGRIERFLDNWDGASPRPSTLYCRLPTSARLLTSCPNRAPRGGV